MLKALRKTLALMIKALRKTRVKKRFIILIKKKYKRRLNNKLINKKINTFNNQVYN